MKLRSTLRSSCRLALPVILLVSAVLAMPRAALADPGEAGRLFDEALVDMKTAEFGVACPKLERSLALEARSGTQISLAFCLDKLGKKGAAWHHYREAAALARAEGRADYVEKATKLASELEPKLAPLRLSLGPTPGVRATLDDIPLDPARSELFVDPGLHVLRASAEGHAPLEERLEVEPAGRSFSLPALSPLAVSPQTQDPAPMPTPAPTARDDAASGLLVGGAVLTAVGGASLVTSFVLGGLVLGNKSTVESTCDLEARTCTQEGLDAAADGSAQSVAASVLFAVGLASAGVGVTLLAVDATSAEPGAPALAVRLRATALHFSVEGTFR